MEMRACVREKTLVGMSTRAGVSDCLSWASGVSDSVGRWCGTSKYGGNNRKLRRSSMTVRCQMGMHGTRSCR